MVNLYKRKKKKKKNNNNKVVVVGLYIKMYNILSVLYEFYIQEHFYINVSNMVCNNNEIFWCNLFFFFFFLFYVYIWYTVLQNGKSGVLLQQNFLFFFKESL